MKQLSEGYISVLFSDENVLHHKGSVMQRRWDGWLTFAADVHEGMSDITLNSVWIK